MKEIDINLNDEKYPVYITNNFDSLNGYMDEHKIDGKILIVTDEKVGELYANELTRRLLNKNVCVFKMKEGEHYKSLDTVMSIYDECHRNKLNRSSAVMALGGGVVGDTAGFAASTYMRGIRFVQVPTTVIADVDSSVGGKVGVNYRDIKNLVGSFYHPDFIYINTSVLRTLDRRQLISGIAEVIKYAVLFDRNFFNYLEENSTGLLNLESDKLNYIIKKCISMKVDIVRNDIKDHGKRHVLNFGHTIGHAIESMCDYTIYHGEAVALGMMTACAMSNILGMLSENEMQDIFNLLYKYDLVCRFNFGNIDMMLDIIKHDKKSDRGNNKLVLLSGIGSGVVIPEIKEDVIIRSLRFIEKYIEKH